jgi:hypothetical protein
MKRFAQTMMMTAALLPPALFADEQIQDRKQNRKRASARRECGG